MIENRKLWAEADQRAAAFRQSTSAVIDEFRPVRLLDQTVGALDPNFALLDRITVEAKRNPIAVLVLGGGLWLLMRQLKSGDLKPSSLTRQGKRPLRLSRAIREGEENDNLNHAKHF
jgi:hypothetical protein